MLASSHRKWHCHRNREMCLAKGDGRFAHQVVTVAAQHTSSDVHPRFIRAELGVCMASLVILRALIELAKDLRKISKQEKNVYSSIASISHGGSNTCKPDSFLPLGRNHIDF
ncbi:hypothetical protein M440DRAFT_1272774 [Trichoderma longibrachiatum ATCC 18648]|uniref:Uncharacterized protein n=1 Tax=Trichoderma longibrachiatum ATCC 18648 TaxID=983965 RepID=A0A2T4C1C7_TRILO|nr:hypothetical protein M440DRAFT_1272774 [Trichoderma longibrachiatum ATCC 18648]